MALIAHAETAQDIAAGLNKFLDSVPEHSTEITALISECFAISSALRELTTAIGDSRFNRRYHEVADDITVTLRSLEYTFEDVRRLFGGLGRADHFSEAAAYRAVWTEITMWFQEEKCLLILMTSEFFEIELMFFYKRKKTDLQIT
ncbi:hypothetical protein G7Y79_00030g065280 [Physcia stellaris]|nr:hypothetical protein G7Y79_00030g065280 [Physcia stellaris]